MTSCDLKLATITIQNLNADLSITANVPNNTCGLYALINDMITNLSSIKSSIRSQEKLIVEGINSEIASAGNSLNNSGVVQDCGTTATINCTSGIGDNATRFIAGDSGEIANVSNFPAVLVGTNNYNETAVFAILAQCSTLINKLKNNAYSSGTINFEETLTLTN